ncbi:MAG: hypothetical protein H6719_09785 [Sandaracinaceae bacterium]|nr:hypothetical protein [Sandaracinaceae bacterium]
MGSAKHGDGARRYRPEDLPGLDLATPDERLAWATWARGSSTYSSSYGAGSACGSPTVYPESGDRRGTWLADSEDAEPWLEVELPEVEGAAALLVCETCGAGAVHEIRDLDRNEVLWERKPETGIRDARLVCVPLEGRPPPRRLRLALAPYAFGDAYHEIDAVGLALVPLDDLRAEPPGLRTAHERLEPSAVARLELRDDPRVHWATSAHASSEWSSSYAARKAVGPPRVFPRGGDLENTWLSKDRSHDEWLELAFDVKGPVHGIIVLETCGAGAVYKITDEHGGLLWGARPEVVPEREARLLHVALAAAVAPKRLRLWVSAAVDDYREIDAVALLSAPFESLSEPPPPPGEPEEGWTALEGTLVGDLPFVHAVLRTRNAGRAATSKGSVRLRVASGEEIPLDTERAAVLGVPVVRARGSWAEVARELPWAAACFEDPGVGPDEPVVLEGRRVLEGVTVEALGDDVGVRARGFRDSARGLPERLVTAALAVGSREGFDHLGADAFERSARRFEEPRTVPRPLHPLVVGTTTAAVVTGLGWLVSAGAAGSTAVVSLLCFVAFAFTGVLAVEHAARMTFLPASLPTPSGSRLDTRVGFTRPDLTVMVNGLVLVLSAVVLVAATEIMEVRAGAARAAYALAAGFACVRLAKLLRVAWGPLRESLSLLRAPELSRVVGARGRVSGTLGHGPFSRRERWTIRAKHLGTGTSTDDAGNLVTHERYETWHERHATGQAPSALRLITADGATVRATETPPTTDVGMTPRSARLADLAYFESLHEEGDPATLLGVVEAVGDGIEIRPTHLLLGRLEELRRRVRIQVLAIGVLALGATLAGLAAMNPF